MMQIVIENLSKYYGKKCILKDLNLVLNNQNIYFLTSENGSGKTTFFKCLLDETKYKGRIKDKNLTYAYLPEKVITPDFVTVIDFLRLILRIDYKEVDDDLIDKYLKKFGILEYKNTYVNKLSKGTKQKVFIIKMVLSNADVYLFDEPLSGLDLKSRKTFMKVLNELYRKKKIIIVASHYYDEYDLINKKVISFNEII